MDVKICADRQISCSQCLPLVIFRTIDCLYMAVFNLVVTQESVIDLFHPFAQNKGCNVGVEKRAIRT